MHIISFIKCFLTFFNFCVYCVSVVLFFDFMIGFGIFSCDWCKISSCFNL